MAGTVLDLSGGAKPYEISTPCQPVILPAILFLKASIQNLSSNYKICIFAFWKSGT